VTVKPVIDTAGSPGEASSKAAAIRRALACTPARDRYEVRVEPHHIRPHVCSWWIALVLRQPAQH
jgi:hypothetical protein